MLDGRGEDVGSAGIQAMGHQAELDEVIALGRATREHDLFRPPSEECGNRGSGNLYGVPGLVAVEVGPAPGIAELRQVVGLHGLEDSRVERCRRVVVEVNRSHGVSPRDAAESPMRRLTRRMSRC